MSIQATAIYRHKDRAGFGMNEVKADDKATAIARAERVGKRLGEHFAVAWDLVEIPEGQEAPRRVKMADGREMPWEEFVAKHGAEIGLL